MHVKVALAVREIRRECWTHLVVRASSRLVSDWRGPKYGLRRDVFPSWSKWSGVLELPSLVQGSGTRLRALTAMDNDSRRCSCPPFREKFYVADSIESSLSILEEKCETL